MRTVISIDMDYFPDNIKSCIHEYILTIPDHYRIAVNWKRCTLNSYNEYKIDFSSVREDGNVYDYRIVIAGDIVTSLLREIQLNKLGI